MSDCVRIPDYLLAIVGFVMCVGTFVTLIGIVATVLFWGSKWFGWKI